MTSFAHNLELQQKYGRFNSTIKSNKDRYLNHMEFDPNIYENCVENITSSEILSNFVQKNKTPKYFIYDDECRNFEEDLSQSQKVSSLSFNAFSVSSDKDKKELINYKENNLNQSQNVSNISGNESSISSVFDDNLSLKGDSNKRSLNEKVKDKNYKNLEFVKPFDVNKKDAVSNLNCKKKKLKEMLKHFYFLRNFSYQLSSSSQIICDKFRSDILNENDSSKMNYINSDVNIKYRSLSDCENMTLIKVITKPQLSNQNLKMTSDEMLNITKSSLTKNSSKTLKLNDKTSKTDKQKQLDRNKKRIQQMLKCSTRKLIEKDSLRENFEFFVFLDPATVESLLVPFRNAKAARKISRWIEDYRTNIETSKSKRVKQLKAMIAIMSKLKDRRVVSIEQCNFCEIDLNEKTVYSISGLPCLKISIKSHDGFYVARALQILIDTIPQMRNNIIYKDRFLTIHKSTSIPTINNFVSYSNFYQQRSKSTVMLDSFEKYPKRKMIYPFNNKTIHDLR